MLKKISKNLGQYCFKNLDKNTLNELCSRQMKEKKALLCWPLLLFAIIHDVIFQVLVWQERLELGLLLGHE